MSTHRLRTVLDHVYQTAGRPESDSDTDARLLGRYTGSRDEAAFSELVRRHGPLVLGVCRRALNCRADVDDAFQATFLVLARRAATIRRPASLSSWLHGVAWRIAHKLRTPARTQELPADSLPDCSSDPARAAAWREVCGVLDEELYRLPERLRGPLVLCYLEGLTRDEAAIRLGYSPSSLKRRLERGRGLLKARLTRRGVTLGAALAGASLGKSSAAAAVPARLLALATCPASASGRVVQLATAAMAASAYGKPLLAVMGVLGMVLALGAGVGQRGELPPTQPPNPPPVQAPVPAADRFGDPLPPGAIARLGTTRYRHGAGINGAAITLDGKSIVVTSRAATTLVDLETGRRQRTFDEAYVPDGFSSHYRRLSFSPDGKTLACVSDDATVQLWDITADGKPRHLGTPRRVFPGNMPRSLVRDAPTSVQFSRGGTQVFVICRQLINFSPGLLLVYDSASGQLVRRLEFDVNPIVVTPDGRTILTQKARENDFILADIETGKEVRRFAGDGPLGPFTFGADGQTLIALDGLEDIRFWDVNTGKRLRSFKLPKSMSSQPPNLTMLAISPVTMLTVSPDGHSLLAGTRAGGIFRWDLATGRELPPLRGHVGQNVTGLFFPPGGRALVSVGWDNVIRRWDLLTGDERPAGDGYTSLRATYLPDGRSIVVGDAAGKLELCDPVTGARAHALRLSGPGIVRLTPVAGEQTLAVGQSDGAVSFWDIASRREMRSVRLSNPAAQPDRRSYLSNVTPSPDGRFLLTTWPTDGVRLWELSSGGEVWHQAARDGADYAAFSPDGLTIVTGGFNRTLGFYDAKTGRERLTVNVRTGPGDASIDAITFSPDGRILANSQRDHVICLRDPATGEERKRLTLTADIVWHLSFSPDSRWLLAACLDHTARVLEVATGQEVLCLKGHQGWVMHAEFSPDVRTALTSSFDLTALVWSLRPVDAIGANGNEDTLWADLTSDAPAAYRALWSLVDAPQVAADLLGRKLVPVRSGINAEQVRKLIAELDKGDFRTREAAAKALAGLGPLAEPLLRDALGQAPTLETAQRLRQLLERLRHEPTADELRVVRAVQVMEMCGTPEARAVLRRWASGDAGAPLTEEARAALARLDRKQ